MRLIKFISLGLLILLLMNCSSKREAVSMKIFDDQFAFVEFYQTIDSKVIRGNVPMGRRIDSPSYFYDSQNKAIEIYRNTNNIQLDSLKILLGTGKILKGNAGKGMSSLLIGINKIPYTYSDLSFERLNKNKIYLKYKNQEFVLASGAVWKQDIVSNDTIPSLENAIVQTVVSTNIVFHGFLPKSTFQKKNNPNN